MGLFARGAIMSNNEPYNEASKTNAVDGEVVIQGPDSVGVSVTPSAAEKTAQRLIRTARTARAQLIRKGAKKPGNKS
jgi:hypothetical protein